MVAGGGGNSPLEGGKRGWRPMILCARGTRGLRRPSLDARSRGQSEAIPGERVVSELEGALQPRVARAHEID